MPKTQIRNLAHGPRAFVALDAAGEVVAQGELTHNNPKKLAKFIMNKYPGTVKVKIRTNYIAANHPRGLDHETRTFVK